MLAKKLEDSLGACHTCVCLLGRVDGREIEPVDPEEIKAVVQEIKSKGIKRIVVCGIFSPTCTPHEDQVSQVYKRMNVVAITFNLQPSTLSSLVWEAFCRSLRHNSIISRKATIGILNLGAKFVFAFTISHIHLFLRVGWGC